LIPALIHLEPGDSTRLGATIQAGGVNFALWAPQAERVELCLFDPATEAEVQRIDLPGFNEGVWHGYANGLGSGLLYGYRSHGEWSPRQGLRFNPDKLLVDPWARGLSGRFEWHGSHLDEQDGYPVPGDNSAFTYKAVTTDTVEPRHHRPAHPFEETIIYEAHVKGLTQLHPDIPEQDRGTFKAIASRSVRDHLLGLGITALELMPVFAFADEPFLSRKGLSNYWGYNPVNWFAPHPDYGTPEDFQDMVRCLHNDGIEVILDVVFNHSAEGGRTGSQLNLKGMDNRGFYSLDAENSAEYRNYTGCGNILNADSAIVQRLVMESLIYWHEFMGVDGFRFDLATTLGRHGEDFDPEHNLLNQICNDKRLKSAKLIMEPWDIGPNGYQAGNFGHQTAEWNDGYRDDIRDFWLGGGKTCSVIAQRLTASAYRFKDEHRMPWSDIHYICAHDGFNLTDVVSYQQKHNWANGEDDRDGHNDNRSINCGVEGPTDNEAILHCRRIRVQALLSTLFCSQGTPMLYMGDEMGHSRAGNNNAYCQDNAVNWLDWSQQDKQLLKFVQGSIALRRDNPALRLPYWVDIGSDVIQWCKLDGSGMDEASWHDNSLAAMAVYLQHADSKNAALLLINASTASVSFKLPCQQYIRQIDSAEVVDQIDYVLPAGGEVTVSSHSIQVLIRHPEEVSNKELQRLGIDRSYQDNEGVQRSTPLSSILAIQSAMADSKIRQAHDPNVANISCFKPQWFNKDLPVRGISLQVYALRSCRNWGIGDFEDLKNFAIEAANNGVDFLAINPLHARPLATPESRSPYAPTSRLWLDPLYIAVDKLAIRFNLEDCLEDCSELATISNLRDGLWVNYPAVATLKLEALASIFNAFQLSSQLAREHDDFALFIQTSGSALQHYVQFENQQLKDSNATLLNKIKSEALKSFLCWLQWIADDQLKRVQAACKQHGMRVGLYRDLAVGPHLDGAEASSPEFARGLEIGAPPDAFTVLGQAWGIAPMNPHSAELENGFRALIEHNTRHAGALRIDHVMGLQRLFWVPNGIPPSQGAYVNYPATLERVLADESQQQLCIIIGEDLGTLPFGFREHLDNQAILGLSIAMFERHGDDFVDPTDYRRNSVACFATHDLPTFSGWWQCGDIELRRSLNLIHADQYQHELQQRESDRHKLCSQIGIDISAEHSMAEITVIMHQWLSSSSAAMVQFQLDDLTLEIDPVNLPGTVDEYPNWSRKYSVNIEAMPWHEWHGLFYTDEITREG
jgi:glycogen debranching enzyme GlgX/4-alpha-glucanotransferase